MLSVWWVGTANEFPQASVTAKVTQACKNIFFPLRESSSSDAVRRRSWEDSYIRLFSPRTRICRANASMLGCRIVRNTSVAARRWKSFNSDGPTALQAHKARAGNDLVSAKPASEKRWTKTSTTWCEKWLGLISSMEAGQFPAAVIEKKCDTFRKENL